MTECDIEGAENIFHGVPFLYLRMPILDTLHDEPVNFVLLIKPCVSVSYKLEITSPEIVLHDIKRHVIGSCCFSDGHVFSTENRVALILGNIDLDFGPYPIGYI